MEKFTVLIVDDIKANVYSIKEMLETMDVRILEAFSSDEILIVLNQHQVNLILMDMFLPKIDGYEIAKIIRENPKFVSIPIIFVTAKDASNILRIRGIESGEIDFIFKPINKHILQSKIKNFHKLFLAQRELEIENEKLNQAREMVLRENESRIKSENALIEAQRIAKIGSWELDLATKIITASKVAFQIYGIEQESPFITLKKAKEIPLKIYRELLDSQLQNLIERKGSYNVTFQLRQENTQKLLYVHSSAILQFNDLGEPIKVIGTIQDINDLMQTKLELQTTQDRLQNVINATNVGIWEWDIQKDEFYSNDRLTNMLGYELNEYPTVKSERFKIIHPLDLPIIEKHIETIFNKSTKQYSIEYRMKHKDGHWVWIHDLGNVVSWSKNGDPLLMTGTHLDITSRKTSEIKLVEDEQRFRNLFEKAPFGYQSLDSSGKFLDVNQKWCDIIGYSKNEVIGMKFTDLLTMESKPLFKESFNRFKKSGISHSEYSMKTKNGRIIQVGFDGTIGYNSKNQFQQTHCTVSDITEISMVTKLLKESESKYRQLINLMPLGLALHEIVCDSTGVPIDYTFLDANSKFLEQIGKKLEDIRGKSVLEVFPETEEYWIKEYGKVALCGLPIIYENYAKSLDKYFKVSAYSPQPNQFAVIAEDITFEKKKQLEIEFLSNHDYLSGLYNRRYFVEKFKELDSKGNYPLGVMMLDVNGLKIINDTFGHNVGDLAILKATSVFYDSFRPQDTIARIGGDEFAVILPQISSAKIEDIKSKLADNLKDVTIENISLSIATGYHIKDNDSLESLDHILQLAENHMYRHKLSEGISSRNNAIKAILKTLSDKYEEEKIHSSRVSFYSRKIGTELHLRDEDLKELELAGLYHDIGKISIPDDILRKPGKLTKDEYDIIKTHPEIGYQILRAADQYSDLAVHALHHHERWDGLGYPSGQKGTEIPLYSRIIGIADAFEAMTSVRPYKDKMSEDAAAQEILRCSGTQFDPKIAKIFVEKVLKKPWK
ncbi:MAG: PAS domain S-box protein [Firmicutes bacterium]|nr:PAS domain S-box protein [Bacillota bacterium]